ncbi:MAG: AraC family transcriptional regulator [Victivallales bacterium]|nr:AraC family transcriptional regulator [Victivallales bacterium]
MLFGGGHELVLDQKYRWDGLKRGTEELCIWQYTLKGRGELRFKNRIYPVLPGQAMLLMVPEDHCYYFPAGAESWEFIFINMYGSEIIRLFNQLRNRSNPIVEFAPDSPPILQAINICHLIEDDQIIDQYQASALAYNFMMALVSDIIQDEKSQRPAFINRVYEYCLQNIHRTITIDDMARCAGYSTYHFARLFKQYAGNSPHSFLNELRIRMAVRLFQTGCLSVKEVALRCGFEDSSYFCKVFRKHQKVSPKKFREG